MAGGDSGEVVLTYRELGERLGIEPDSARARARRHGWRVVLDNHGVARVHVPPANSLTRTHLAPLVQGIGRATGRMYGVH